MRSHAWKLLGGALLGGVVVVCILGTSQVAADDPADQSPDDFVPGQTFGLGPNPISYETQPTEEQDNIDRVYDQLEANQAASSHEAFARAADQAVVDAKAEIAARHVGLEGVEEQGVVP